MNNCIFCKIIEGRVKSNVIYEDKCIIAFHDINPSAAVHVLVVPKKHILSLNELSESDASLIANLTFRIPKIASYLGIQNGYKVLVNNGKNGGQHVFHLHYHVLGGKPDKSDLITKTW